MDLDRASGVSQSNISRFLRDPTKTLSLESVIKIAKGFGISEMYLRFEVDIKQIKCLNYVPVITWDNVIDYQSAINEAKKKGGAMFIATVPTGDQTFGLEITEPNSLETEFNLGDYLVIEPELTTISGDYVIVEVNGSVALKQLIIDLGVCYLKSLDRAIPTKPLGDGQVIGVVREKIKIYH